MKFRKKPVIIEATQWFKNGDHPNDFDGMFNSEYPCGCPSNIEGKIVRYFRRPDVPSDGICNKCGHHYQNHGWIDTFEGDHRVCPGDWIITGIKGEFYPCKPDIFEMTYEVLPD